MVAKYGERLVCVRYRCDPAKNKRYKTAELVVAEDDGRAPAPHPHEDRSRRPAPKRCYTRRAGICIENTQRQNCADGSRPRTGWWNPSERLRFVPENEVRRLGPVQRAAKR